MRLENYRSTRFEIYEPEEPPEAEAPAGPSSAPRAENEAPLGRPLAALAQQPTPFAQAPAPQRQEAAAPSREEGRLPDSKARDEDSADHHPPPPASDQAPTRVFTTLAPAPWQVLTAASSPSAVAPPAPAREAAPHLDASPNTTEPPPDSLGEARDLINHQDAFIQRSEAQFAQWSAAPPPAAPSADSGSRGDEEVQAMQSRLQSLSSFRYSVGMGDEDYAKEIVIRDLIADLNNRMGSRDEPPAPDSRGASLSGTGSAPSAAPTTGSAASTAASDPPPAASDPTQPPQGNSSITGGSIYPDRYQPVPGLSGKPPAGGQEGLTLARELPPLASEYTPTLPDGRAGTGVPYRDQAGQLYYRTFDANGAEVGWVSAPVQVARLDTVVVTGRRNPDANATDSAPALASLGALPVMARLAPIAQGVIEAEIAIGPPPLKAIAIGSVAAAGGLAAWLATRDSDTATPRSEMLPEDERLGGKPLINVPPPPGPGSPPPLTPPEIDTPIHTGAPMPEVKGPNMETLPIHEQDPYAGIVTRDGKDAEELGNNLTGAGKPKPGEGYQPHHVIPVEAGGSKMDAVRDKLKELGIDINDAANGVWLPGPKADPNAPEAYHPRLNNRDYNQAIIDE